MAGRIQDDSRDESFMRRGTVFGGLREGGMPISSCHGCGGNYSWSWTEAFEKFDVSDGNLQIETRSVEPVLIETAFDVIVEA
jgi:hypothetical protein